jgi:hypothetical protein
VFVREGVTVGVDVFEGVRVTVAVCDGVRVTDGVRVSVGVDVFEGVRVTVGVSDGVGAMTECACATASLWKTGSESRLAMGLRSAC